ncbi:MAG: insulinase family protein [Candidatus Acetothermia bacterium]|nr:insulinase family protein [Candidatus Acetothermia bacterium]MDH7504742.1 pitrilysin family protein [Candidatus Acetothermia bacterium]
MKELYPGCSRGELANGLVVIAETRDRRPLSLGLWVRAGSRDEPEERAGAAHFLEHLLFKGTANRTAFQIAEEIDSLGGVVNGATHEEYTLLYVNVLSEHLERALDILADLVRNPLLREADIEREKGVVLEEIRMVEDNPQEKIFDLFIERSWKDRHPLSRPVLGRAETVKRLSRADLLEQFALYAPTNMVLVGVGGIEFGQLAELAEKKLGDSTKRAAPPERRPPAPQRHFHLEDRDSQQAHLCLGAEGLARADERRYALEVMNAILGSGMSSRLFKRIREELGLAYAVFSMPNYYLDSGLFLIYIGTEPRNAPRTVEIALEEVERLRREPVSPERLKLAKEKLKGNLLLGLESSQARMVRLGLGELYDLHMATEDVIARIESVTAADVQEVACETFARPLSLTALGPEKPLRELERFFS